MTNGQTLLQLVTLKGEIIPSPLYSMRQMRQILRPLKPRILDRTPEGTYLETSHIPPLKFSSVLQGEDEAPPAWEPWLMGIPVIMSCVVPLAQAVKAQQTEVKLIRPWAEGSIAFQRHDASAPDPLRDVTFDQALSTLKLQESFNAEGTLFYRPILTVILVDFKVEKDEWAHRVHWELIFHEV